MTRRANILLNQAGISPFMKKFYRGVDIIQESCQIVKCKHCPIDGMDEVSIDRCTFSVGVAHILEILFRHLLINNKDYFPQDDEMYHYLEDLLILSRLFNQKMKENHKKLWGDNLELPPK